MLDAETPQASARQTTPLGAIRIVDLDRGVLDRSMTGTTCGRPWRLSSAQHFSIGRFLERFQVMVEAAELRGVSDCHPQTHDDDDAGIDDGQPVP